MKRRSFIQKSAYGALAAGMMSPIGSEAQPITSQKAKGFPLKFAPHLGMFKQSAGEDPVGQIQFMADQGFTAFEDNGMSGRSVETQKALAAALQKNEMTMGVFVAHKIYWNDANLASGDPEKRAEFLADIKKSIEVAKRVNAKWMTVVPGHVDLRKNEAFQTSNVIESLKQASALLEPEGLVMVLEPLNFMNHPGMFLSRSPQAYQICKAVDSPSCKILFDIYHQQIQEGNLIPNIEACWDEIAYFQVGDNPGRNEPTTGEINYKNVFNYIAKKGFKGVVGMEHGNSKPDKAGEEAVIEAYREVSMF